jgi:indole-3-glycerol phosphate synthase
MVLASILCAVWLISVVDSSSRFGTALRSSRSSNDPSATYLERMVERKKIEVDALLKRHQSMDDPLVMRMSYMASECKYNVTKALKREPDGKEGLHTMSVMVDLKRKSPTIPESRNIVDFANAGKFAELLALSGVDSFLINTDQQEYGGSYGDLKECVKSVKAAKSRVPPPIINKDIIIHPVQVQLNSYTSPNNSSHVVKQQLSILQHRNTSVYSF